MQPIANTEKGCQVMPREIHECECEICRTGSDPEVALQHRRMNLLLSRLNEPQRRWYVGTLSQQPGQPSDRELSKITGLDEKTIQRGRRELAAEFASVPADRQRAEGGGRPAAEKKPGTRRDAPRDCGTTHRGRSDELAEVAQLSLARYR